MSYAAVTYSLQVEVAALKLSVGGTKAGHPMTRPIQHPSVMGSNTQHY